MLWQRDAQFGLDLLPVGIRLVLHDVGLDQRIERRIRLSVVHRLGLTEVHVDRNVG